MLYITIVDVIDVYVYKIEITYQQSTRLFANLIYEQNFSRTFFLCDWWIFHSLFSESAKQLPTILPRSRFSEKLVCNKKGVHLSLASTLRHVVIYREGTDLNVLVLKISFPSREIWPNVVSFYRFFNKE